MDTPTHHEPMAMKNGKSVKLFLLPPELQAQTLAYLTRPDLFAFRNSCRAAHRHVSSDDFLQHWAWANFGRQQLKMYPPPTPFTFNYLAGQERRISTAKETATRLAEEMRKQSEKTLRTTFDVRFTFADELLDFLMADLENELLPSILTLQHYLEYCAGLTVTILDTPGRSLGLHYPGLEKRCFSLYDTQQLLQAHKLWLFICDLLNKLVLVPAGRPTYLANHGSLTNAPPRDMARRFLIFGNLAALNDVLEHQTRFQRCMTMQTWLQRLHPCFDSDWERNWKAALPYRCQKPPTRGQAKIVLSLHLQTGDVWTNSARSALKRRGAVLPEHEIERQSGTERKSFLREMTGYDGLGLPPLPTSGGKEPL